MAVLLTTNHGNITIELNAEKAPKTVENFLAYVNSGHYDGTIFHRVIDGFMIQGGGFEPGMKQKPTNEPLQNEAKNGLKNEPYALAMARTSDPHSASAQFFINTKNNSFLDYPGQDGWGYCGFGKVTEGKEVVDKIRTVKTTRTGGLADVPVDDVIIQKGGSSLIDTGRPITMDPTQTAPSAVVQPATVALFISDLHLHASMPRTAKAFFEFLSHQASKTQQLYLLGDIFEYWAGDDDTDAFNRQVVHAIRKVSDAGVDIFWIAGNRDFLVGSAFAEASGVKLLPDPFVTCIAEQRLVLTHGDAQCTDDIAYMAFRTQVRQPEWQRDFLARSLEQRKAIIADLRQGSREAQRNKADNIMDVNADAIASLHEVTAANIMIHGHTHRPAKHVVPGKSGDRVRYVLPDWDVDNEPVRGGWIAITADGLITRTGADGLTFP